MKSETRKQSASGSKSEKTLKAVPVLPKVSRTHKPDDIALEEWQRVLRRQFGERQDFVLNNTGEHPIFSDFSLTNPQSGKTYKIAIRGEEPGVNYCSCPDYSVNNLGTCKHIEFTLSKLLEKPGAKEQLQEGYAPPYSEIYLSYGLKREARFRQGQDAPAELIALANEYFDAKGALKEQRLLKFHKFLAGIPRNNGHEVRCYDDVMAYVAQCQEAAHHRAVVDARLHDGIESALFDAIVKTNLYPYQREGALFAIKAGRCLMGDDMGLGKTVQAIAVAELMAELFNIGKVLIISPTSLKYQWKTEIEKFGNQQAMVIEGLNHRRRPLYRQDSFYKLINYELVARDLEPIREWSPDLIILDEAQRIKNWKTRTAKTVKELESAFAIVLTGTPIENRIEELHSIMEFVDRYHLGPLYRFVHNHRVVDSGGKVIGYQNLDKVRNSLKTVMIRRKKDEVLKQLPPRIDKNFLVPMTPEQQAIHDENMEIVAKLVAKWRRYKFLCEADQLRLQIALAYMRMAADNTYLIDHKTVHGPKLEELEILLRELVIEGGEKAVIFSQWLRMTELIENVLRENNIGYVHLNGSVPSKNRGGLMAQFREDPACKVFLSTDAGGVGLNLQSGSVIINMDIPWNPAVLEQRIGRVHRMGQGRTVRVVNFVTRASIEERILDLLRFKKALFTGALDDDGMDVVMVGDAGMERFMQSVEEATDNLERPDPELEKQEQSEAAADEKTAQLREMSEEGPTPPKTSQSGGGNGAEVLHNLLVGGAQFLMNLSQAISQLPQEKDAASAGNVVQPVQKALNAMLGKDETTGKSYLKIPLPETEALNQVFTGLGQLLSGIMQMNR